MAAAFLRTLATTTTTTVAALSALSFPNSHTSPSPSPSHSHSHSLSSSSSSSSLHFKPIHSSFLSASAVINGFTRPLSANTMDAPTYHQDGASLPELITEFMVDMSCEGCVTSVRNKLQSLQGVKNVEVDLSNQVVRVLGTSPLKTLSEALEQTGRKARLIGQGNPDDFLVSAAVSEFKGPDIFGVVRFAQVNMELARIEATLSGLSPGKHGWSINEYGDLTRGAESTGKIYDPETAEEVLGDLGTLDVDEKGETFFSGVKKMLRVVDLIGRSVVVYESEDKSVPGIAAAVIARSAGVGENYKKLCTCDGTTIWEATSSDFTTSKV